MLQQICDMDSPLLIRNRVTDHRSDNRGFHRSLFPNHQPQNIISSDEEHLQNQEHEVELSHKLIISYILQLLSFPYLYTLLAYWRSPSRPGMESAKAEASEEPPKDPEPPQSPQPAILKSHTNVTNDYHLISKNHAAENSILVGDLSDLQLGTPPPPSSIISTLLLEGILDRNDTPLSRQYGTDISVSKSYLKRSKYQNNYFPARRNELVFHDSDRELFNPTQNSTYQESILNFYLPAKPISSANYSFVDSVISNFQIDRISTLYSQNHEKIQNFVTNKRLQSASSITALDKSQTSQVTQIWNSRTNSIIVSSFQIDMSADDLKTLRDGCWINDNVIDFYINLIVESTTTKVYGWTTHFYTTLLEKGYQGVARWAKRRKLNVFEKEIILVPVNIMNTHWALAVIDNINMKIEYYDSLSSPGGNSTAVKVLANYMSQEATRLGRDPCSYQLSPNIKTPQQRNGSDCGVFTCTAARFILDNKPLSYSQNDMKTIRRQMVYEIINKKLIH